MMLTPDTMAAGGWRRTLTGLATVTAFIVVGGCVSAPAHVPGPPVETGAGVDPVQPAATIAPVTRLPAAGYGTEMRASEARTELIMPAGSLVTAVVVRPKADVRSGPGVEFELLDWSLNRDRKVLVFESSGMWRKIRPVDAAAGPTGTGWVHAKTLGEPVTNSGPVRLSQAHLPTVTAVRPIAQVGGFPGQAAIGTRIPRGAIFQVAHYGADSVLVIVPGTASLMWLPRKDVQ